jgi:hypothetical protein
VGGRFAGSVFPDPTNGRCRPVRGILSIISGSGGRLGLVALVIPRVLVGNGLPIDQPGLSICRSLQDLDALGAGKVGKRLAVSGAE